MGEEGSVIFYHAGVAGYEEDEVDAFSVGRGGGIVQVDGGGGGWGRHVEMKVDRIDYGWGDNLCWRCVWVNCRSHVRGSYLGI